MAILCIPPIGMTQLGWYFFGKEMGLNLGMIAGYQSLWYLFVIPYGLA